MSQLLSAFRYAALPQSTQAFREEVREFLRTTWQPAPPAGARALLDGLRRRLQPETGRARLGRRHAAASEYGGASLDAFRRFVLVEELLAAARRSPPTGSPTARAGR